MTLLSGYSYDLFNMNIFHCELIHFFLENIEVITPKTSTTAKKATFLHTKLVLQTFNFSKINIFFFINQNGCQNEFILPLPLARAAKQLNKKSFKSLLCPELKE